MKNSMAKSDQNEQIIARRARIKDNLARTRMAIKVADFAKEDKDLDRELWDWLTLVTRTESIPGYTLPSAEASADDLWAAFQAYTELPADAGQQWENAVESANKPAGVLVPPAALPDDQKKVPT